MFLGRVRALFHFNLLTHALFKAPGMKSVRFLLIRQLLLLLFFANSCVTTSHITPVGKPSKSYGNPDADNIIIIAQDGPSIKLEEYLVEDIFIQSYLLEREAIHVLQVHQAQTMYPDQFTLFDYSYNDAKIFTIESVEYLVETVSGAKQSGKNVYVAGIGYGAFIVQELLAIQGNVADGYLLTAARMDWEEAAWITLSQGTSIKFVDGITIQPIFQESNYHTANMNKLAAGLGYNRYTEKLENVSMDNVIFAYGLYDEKMGRLNEDEIDFLKSKDTTIYTWETWEDHSEIIEKSLAPCLEKLLGLGTTDVIWPTF